MSKFSVTSQAARVGHRAWAVLSGVAADYWKDGDEIPFVKKKRPVRKKANNLRKTAEVLPGVVARAEKSGLWHAEYPEILETMWGRGQSLPCGDAFIDMLTVPAGLDKGKSVLDLSAGLGAIGRRLADSFGTYVTGLEPDIELAEYGMALSVQSGHAKHATVDFYDPEKFSVEKHYDCIIAREIFYQISGKKRFFKEIEKSLKKTEIKGHLIFTDYILEPESKKDHAVTAWLNHETQAAPLPLKEMKKMWSKNGFDVRVSEDLTEMYRKEILKALARLTVFLQKHMPDAETKKLIFDEVETWAFRESAFEHGLKFYRFYAMK